LDGARSLVIRLAASPTAPDELPDPAAELLDVAVVEDDFDEHAARPRLTVTAAVMASAAPCREGRRGKEPEDVGARAVGFLA